MITFASNVRHVGSQIANNPFDKTKVRIGHYVPPNPLNRGAPIHVIHTDRPASTHELRDRTQVTAWMGFIENPNQSMRTHRTPDSVHVMRQVSEQQQLASAGGHDAWLKFHHLSTVMSSGDNVGSTGKRPI